MLFKSQLDPLYQVLAQWFISWNKVNWDKIIFEQKSTILYAKTVYTDFDPVYKILLNTDGMNAANKSAHYQ